MVPVIDRETAIADHPRLQASAGLSLFPCLALSSNLTPVINDCSEDIPVGSDLVLLLFSLFPSRQAVGFQAV